MTPFPTAAIKVKPMSMGLRRAITKKRDNVNLIIAPVAHTVCHLKMEAFIFGIDLFKKTDAYKNYPGGQMLNNNSAHINISEESIRWSSPLALENSG